MKTYLSLLFLLITAPCFAQNGWHHHNGRWHRHAHTGLHRHGVPTVAYYPVVTWYPYGTYLGVGNVQVSPNRRYVRMGINMSFSTYKGYHTFNYRTGQARWYPARR